MSGDAALLDATPAYAAKVQAITPPRKYMAIGETGARYNVCDRIPKTAKCLAYTGTPTELQVRAWQVCKCLQRTACPLEVQMQMHHTLE